MEATCTICKHYSNTLEKHERHNQSAEHLRNMEIYNLGMEHGQYKAAARLAAAEKLAEAARFALAELETLDGASIKDADSGEYISPDPETAESLRAALAEWEQTR